LLVTPVPITPSLLTSVVPTSPIAEPLESVIVVWSALLTDGSLSLTPVPIAPSLLTSVVPSSPIAEPVESVIVVWSVLLADESLPLTVDPSLTSGSPTLFSGLFCDEPSPELPQEASVMNRHPNFRRKQAE